MLKNLMVGFIAIRFRVPFDQRPVNRLEYKDKVPHQLSLDFHLDSIESQRPQDASFSGVPSFHGSFRPYLLPQQTAPPLGFSEKVVVSFPFGMMTPAMVWALQVAAMRPRRV